MDKHILINIGRQFGAGGKGVAAALGERLNVPVYDNELLQKAAEESGFSPAFFRKSDERRRVWRFGSLFGGQSGGREHGQHKSGCQQQGHQLFQFFAHHV